jgi:hypothetical protein
MTTTAIRKKLIDYMQTADDEKINAMYTLVENEIEQLESDIWNDEAFLNELDRRLEYYKSGGKMISEKDANKSIDKILSA